MRDYIADIADIGSRGGGAGELIVTLLLLDVCVRPCIYGACVGCWTSRQHQVYGYPNYWYRAQPPTTVVVTPHETVITAHADHTPPLYNLSMKRDYS